MSLAPLLILAAQLSIVLNGAFSSTNVDAGIAPPYYGLDRPALEYELPPLQYALDALEPYIDEETMHMHYFGHHAMYTEEMNWALKEWRKYLKEKHASRISIIDILRNLSRVPEKHRNTLRKNGGGYVNHVLYWSVMSPNPTNEMRLPQGLLAEEIDRQFTSFQTFKDKFTEAAVSTLGSGYVWLCRNASSENMEGLAIVTTGNEDNPIVQDLHPVLVLDLWEHAYYLKHRHKRSKHISDWWYLVDWTLVEQLDKWWKGAKMHDEL